MRLIDADALLKGKTDHEMISTHIIWNAPTVEAEPVRHGHWIVPNSFTVSCICSVCGFEFNSYEDDILGYPYCANCGAKMDEETEYDEQRQSFFHR